MIFRRKKSAELVDDELETAAVELDAADPDAADPEPSEDTPADGTTEFAEPEIDLDALDELEWRTEGPHDETEVDLDAEHEPDAPRIDLGSLVITGMPGAELRLQMSEETKEIVSVLLIKGDSALELGAYAAPRSGGHWAEWRDEIVHAATEDGGNAVLAEGPFGVELKRFIPVTAPNGVEGYQVSRMWAVEGPRWILRGILYGAAAVEDDDSADSVTEMLTAFRRVVVRRGETARAPGDLLELTLPDGLEPVEPS